MGRGGNDVCTEMVINHYYSELEENVIMRILNKKYWPHHIVTRKDNSSIYIAELDEMEQWCYQNFKSADWRNLRNYFAFKNEEDAMIFSLRWL